MTRNWRTTCTVVVLVAPLNGRLASASVASHTVTLNGTVRLVWRNHHFKRRALHLTTARASGPGRPTGTVGCHWHCMIQMSAK